MSHPFKVVMDIRPGERAFSFLMAGYFFLVITTFWILKPLKKFAFISHYERNPFDHFGISTTAANAEGFAKVGNMIVALLAVWVFTKISSKYRREQLTQIFSFFFIACFLLFIFLLRNPAEVTRWAFYMFGDLFTTLMVAVFFVFLNDSVTPDGAKRLYGLVGLGGVLGGFFGSMVVATLVKRGQTSPTFWMLTCTVTTLIIWLLALGAARNSKPPPPSKPEAPKTEGKEPHPAIAGAKLVFSSKYLFSIASIVGLYEVISQLLEYQMTSTVLHYLSGAAVGEAFNNIYLIMNSTAVVVQLFFTSFIMRRFGLKVALLILPSAILIVSMGYLLVPVLLMAYLMLPADGGFSYSLNQSAKETLYVPLSRSEKYQAKAFIDMFVQRFAKVVTIAITFLVTTLFVEFGTIRWLSLGTLVIIILWLTAVVYAGNRFKELSQSK